MAQSHTPCNRCVRFATAVASGHATLATKRTLLLTWAGLAPAGSHQLAAGALIRSPRRRYGACLPLDWPQGGAGSSEDHIRLQCHEVGRIGPRSAWITSGPTVVDLDIAAL